MEGSLAVRRFRFVPYGVIVSVACGCQTTRSLVLREDASPSLAVAGASSENSRRSKNSSGSADSGNETRRITPAAHQDRLVPNSPDDEAYSPPAERPSIEIAPSPSREIPSFTGSESLTLTELESLAALHNPSLRQAAASAHKSMGFRDQVGLYPNPTVGYSGNQLFDDQTDQHTAFVEQEIVTGGKLERNRNVLAHDVQVQLWELEAQRRRVITDVRQRFYEALAAQRRRELANDFAAILQTASDFTRQRKEAGDASLPDVLQTEIQLNQVQLYQRQATIAADAAWKQLAAVVGVPALSVTRLDGRLPVDSETIDWETTYSELLAASPELSAAQARVCRARAEWDRQEVQPIPNISVMVGAGHDRATGSGLVNTQIGVPLPLWNQNQGNTYAAYSEYCRATQDVERRKLAIKSRLAAAAREYDSAAVEVDQYRSLILPKAKQTLDLEEVAYQAGEVTFVELLIVRRTYFDANLSFVEAQLKLAQADALLDGLLLSGGLEESSDTESDDSLRGATLGGQ